MSSIDAVNSGSAMCTGRGGSAARAGFESRFKNAALAAGLDESSVGGLQDEIKAAVDSAMKSSGSSTDRHQVVQQAVDGVLQKHGVNLDKFHQLMQPSSGGAGEMGGPPAGGVTGSRQADFEAKFKQAALASGLASSDVSSLENEIQSSLSSILGGGSDQSDPRDTIRKAIDDVLKKRGVSLDEFKTQLRSLTGEGAFPLIDEQA